MKKEVFEGLKNLSLEVQAVEEIPMESRLIIALKINRLLEEELKNETATMERKSSKLDMYRFISKDKTRPVMCGVYYDGGYAVASDMQTMTIDRREYPDGWEGKVIGKDGNEVTGYRYPVWRQVVPAEEAATDLGVLDLKTLAEGVRVCKGMGKEVIRLTGAHDTNVAGCVSIKHVDKLVTYMRARGDARLTAVLDKDRPADKVYYVRRAMVTRNGGSTFLIMPVMPKTDEADMYDIQLK